LESEDPAANPQRSTRSLSAEPQLTNSLANLKLDGELTPSPIPSLIHAPDPTSYGLTTIPPHPWVSNVQTSLSLLEVLLRLLALTEILQASHLEATDQWLNFFLEESKATGAEGDENARQQIRGDARRKVGFDPYDESPVKRRGEEYQYQAGLADGQAWGSNPNSPQWSSSSPEATRFRQTGSGWSGPNMQTRSMTGFSDTPSPSPSPLPASPALQGGKADRTNWLKRREGRMSSPLRPRTETLDEGIGTSPGSGVEGGDV